MPLSIKIVFSIVVLIAALASFVFLEWLGQSLSAYLALLFGAFSLLSFWVFPEVIDKKR